MKTTVYRVMHGNRLRFVASKAQDVEDWAKKRFGKSIKECRDFELRVTEEDLKCVNGKLVFSRDGDPHIEWGCPACGELHCTDKDPSDTPPSLFLCENGKRNRKEDNLFWISWDPS